MFKHKYIAARVDRRTYIKGSFKGKFTGRMDLSKSDPRHERFYDIEIVEGDIVTRQDDLVPWMEAKEPSEFAAHTVFPTRLPGKIGVSLHCLNGETKHFKLALKEIKLIDCHLSQRVYAGNEVFGTVIGLVSGYVLHHDMVVDEIEEKESADRGGRDEIKQEQEDKLVGETKKGTAADFTNNKDVLEPIEKLQRRMQIFRMLGALIGLGLLVSVFFVVNSWAIFLVGVGCVALLIRWLKKWTDKRYEPKLSGAITKLSIALASGCLVCGILLYENINPVGKRPFTIVIRCKDGTISHSKNRRGTCSNHGGVKSWSDTLYEEPRNMNIQ